VDAHAGLSLAASATVGTPMVVIAAPKPAEDRKKSRRFMFPQNSESVAIFGPPFSIKPGRSLFLAHFD
jgi:hypothetical protein